MNRVFKWTLESIQAEALKYQSRSEFQKNSRGAYKAALKQNKLNLICGHMKRMCRDPFTEEEIQREALLYTRRVDFQRGSRSIYCSAHKKKILDKVCSHMTLEWNKKWTVNTIKEEAGRYNKRSDFVTKSNGAYEAALRIGIATEILNTLPLLRKKWTYDEAYQEALVYKTRGEFQNKSNKIYDYAHNKGWLDDICSHMFIVGGTSIPEMELFNLIKKEYPNTKKLRERGMNITKYSKIKGFDIDIYIPELKRGIEFDGKYWHGTGFKRNWTKNPEVYHQIKDNYFKSKGIELLHIKEDDWLENKEECVKKCMDFLNKERF